MMKPETMDRLIYIGLGLGLAAALCMDRADAAEVPKLEYLYDTAVVADMMTTFDIKRHAGMYEQNPLLGQHPSDARIAATCALSIALHYGVTYALLKHGASNRVVQGWEAISAAVEVGFVAHNLSIGLRMRF